MNTNDIFHLYSRSGFGISYKEAIEISKHTDPVKSLFNSQKITDLIIELPEIDYDKIPKMSKSEKMKLRKLMVKKNIELNKLWIEKMISDESQLQEKMTLFWHGHFACKIKNPVYGIQLNNIMRTHALDNFGTLLTEVSKSAAMIDFLHTRQNNKMHPNEDFARELCELFTLGRDTVYTEKDISEIARAFTGWTHLPDGTYFFNKMQHDFGEKKIFGKIGQFDGEDVIKLILSKNETAEYIIGKIWNYFVNPEPDQSKIKDLAERFYNSGYDIKDIMEHIFSSKWFYDEKNKGSKIKSPIEFIIGLARSFQMKTEEQKSWAFLQRVLEQVLFDPPNVAGWPGNQNWIDSNRLTLRLRLPSIIITNGDLEPDAKPDYDMNPNYKKRENKISKRLNIQTDWDFFLENNKNDEISFREILIRSMVSEQAENLLSERKPEGYRDEIIQLLSLPEYQLC